MSDQSVPKNYPRDEHGWVKLVDDRGIITNEAALASLIVGALMSRGLIDLRGDDSGNIIHESMRVVARLLEDNLKEDFPTPRLNW